MPPRDATPTAGLWRSGWLGSWRRPTRHRTSGRGLCVTLGLQEAGNDQGSRRRTTNNPKAGPGRERAEVGTDRHHGYADVGRQVPAHRSTIEDGKEETTERQESQPPTTARATPGSPSTTWGAPPVKSPDRQRRRRTRRAADEVPAPATARSSLSLRFGGRLVSEALATWVPNVVKASEG